ncbi:hypothetical protein GVAV_002539 [Gurleya vavrai]
MPTANASSPCRFLTTKILKKDVFAIKTSPMTISKLPAAINARSISKTNPRPRKTVPRKTTIIPVSFVSIWLKIKIKLTVVKMKKWFKENIVSLALPFLERGIISKKDNYDNIYTNRNCSVMVIDKIVFPKNLNNVDLHNLTELIFVCKGDYKNFSLQPQKFFRSVRQENNNIFLNESIILRNKTCFDNFTVILIFFSKENIFYYKGEINLCIAVKEFFKSKEINKYEFIIREINFFAKGEFINYTENKAIIDYKIFSEKGIDEMHYCYETEKFKDTGYFICNFNNEEFKVQKYMCVLCLKKFNCIDKLNKHIKRIHLNISSFIDQNSVLCLKKNSTVEIIKSCNINLYFFESDVNANFVDCKQSFLFYKPNLKRNRKIKIQRLPLKKINAESMEETSRKIICDDWLDIVVKKKLDDMVTINKQSKEFMKKWNVMIAKEKCHPDLETIPIYIEKFIKTNENKEENLIFLVMFYKKGIINQKMVIRILQKICSENK